MSRLIDADALIEMIEKDIQMTEKFMSNFDFANPSEMASKKYASLFSQLNTLKSYKSIINEQPIAFSKEKVVAELEEAKKKNFESWDKATDVFDILIYGNVVNAYGDAISTVKWGGIE